MRKSGRYEIIVKFYAFSLTAEIPFQFEVDPALPSPKHVDFETHNPNILCLTTGVKKQFKILAKDEYENTCRSQDVKLQYLEFQILHVWINKNIILIRNAKFKIDVMSTLKSVQFGNAIPVEHTFCYQELRAGADSSEISSDDVDNNNAPCLTNVCLMVQVNQPGLYCCSLKYRDLEVGSNRTHGAPKLLVCLTPEEENELRNKFDGIGIPGSLTYSSSCRMSLVGENRDFRDFYVGISASSIVFACYQIPLLLYPDWSIPISGRTTVTLLVNQDMHYASENVMLLIHDGLRPSVHLEIESSQGRMFLVVFGHKQGLVLCKLTLRQPILILSR